LSKIVKKYDFLSIETKDNSDHVYLELKDPMGNIMSTSDLGIMIKAMREDMTNEN
jgi:hypothetical protein